MSARAQTVRLNPSQYRVLAGLAAKRGVSEYAMLARVVEAGFLAMLHGTDREADLAAMAREIGAMSERLAEAERCSTAPCSPPVRPTPTPAMPRLEPANRTR